MNKSMAVSILIALAGSWCEAEPPKPLNVTESVEIKAPVDRVWAVAKDFDSLNKWHPGFSKDELVKGTNNEVGAVRKLTIKDGPSFTEELLAFDNATHTYRYKIIESPLPLRDYVATLTVKPGKDGTTKVTWVGKFKRKNPAENPPEAESDAAAVKLITGVFRGGLANLKHLLEG
jgi:mxaD protein